MNTKLEATSGILALKSILLGLLLLSIFLLQVTLWAVRNILIPSAIWICQMIILGIKALNRWCDAQQEIKALAFVPVKALLMPCQPRVLITRSILPSSNNTIVTASRELAPTAKLAASLFKTRPKKPA